jgi:hypothetical protein
MRVIAKRTGLLAGILLACASVAPAQQQSYLYKATLLQPAPGKLLNAIEIYKGIFAEQAKIASEQSPFWMRHSQGDQWDLKPYAYSAPKSLRQRVREQTAHMPTQITSHC